MLLQLDIEITDVNINIMGGCK